MPDTNRFNAKSAAIALVILVIFAAAYVLTLRAHFNETEKRKADISDTGEKNPNHVNIVIKLVSADLNKGEVPARIEFEPHGNLLNPDETLARDLKLYLIGATNKREFDFQKGKRMNPIDVTLDIYEGEAASYPFDEHRAEIDVNLTDAAKEKAAAAKPNAPAPTPAAAANGEGEKSETENASPKPSEAEADNVPIAVDFYGSLQGLDVKAVRGQQKDSEYVDTDITIRRAPTVKFFSIFIMVAQWALALCVVFLLLTVLVGGRKIELAMFSFMAALLFAFPALRNSQPGVPPIGTLSDFLAFFWAELIIALSLLTIIAAWLLRPQIK